jgi:putative membrane protein
MEYTWKKRRKPSVWKGAVAGAVGGLVASWAMNEFSSLMKTVAESGGNGHKQKAKGNGEQEQQDPTIITAEKISETLADIKLNKQQKKKGSTVVHYAFGAVMGAVYGAAAEVAPPVKSLAGLPYGAALFVGADEIALPVLGLSKKPTQYPLSRHLTGLGQHLVYGATVELVRRGMRRAI